MNRADEQERKEAPPVVPGYRLLERVGEGGMGEVFRAAQLAPPREVAVKLLRRPAGGRAAVPHEFRVLASLDHPNVVHVHDYGEAGERTFLVMEYICGPTLRSLLSPGEPWPVCQAAPLLETIAGALEYMHACNVLHLDLKPENVLLVCGDAAETRCCDASLSRCTAKITDFGLARFTRRDGWAGRRTALGTLDYCAPEQRHGLPIDARSDLFALATLAYELLAGRLPGRVYRPASQARPELGARLDAVLARGLARDADERYCSVAEFQSDFAACLQETSCSP